MAEKILFILHVPPPVHGSSMVGKFIQESSIINKAFDCHYVNLGTSASIDQIGKGGIKKLLRYIQIIIQVFYSLIAFKPQICYLAISAKGNAFYKDAVIALIIKTLGFKIAYHFHNKGVSTRQDQWLDNFLYKLLFKNSEVILLSKYLYSDIKTYVPENSVSYCPNGIAEVLDVRKIEKEDDTVEILFLSNLIESKGVFILLEACKILQNKNLNFHCTFVGGEGDLNKEQFTQKVNALDLKDCVQFLGRKYGKEKEEIFATADIFTLPTYYHNECFPLVLLEAMQYSLPVVSTFEGGIREIVSDGKTGFLVPQKDSIALAERLELLIRTPSLRTELGTAGFGKYRDEFTLAIFEKRLKDVLLEIAENKEMTQHQPT